MAQTKTKATKLSPKEKRAAQMAANRKAQLQWWLLGGGLFAAVVITIVLVSLFTEGSLPTQNGIPEP